MKLLLSILALALTSTANAGKISSGGDEMPEGPIWECVSMTRSSVKAEIDFQQNLVISLPNGDRHSFPEAKAQQVQFVFDSIGPEKPLGFTNTYLVVDRETSSSAPNEKGGTDYQYSITTKPLPNRGFVAGLSIYLNQTVESKKLMGKYRARMSIVAGSHAVLKEEMLCTYYFPSIQGDPLRLVREK